MQGPYADHLLDASDVCSNCLRLIRLERVDPTKGGLARELDSHLERHPTRTSIEFAPHEIPHQSEGTFCTCGVEDVNHRLWDPDDVGEERFRKLVKRAAQTLGEKDVTRRRKTFVAYALQAFRHGDNADEALAAGLEAAIATAASQQEARV